MSSIVPYDLIIVGLFGCVAAFSASGWIGALRSDYTGQLVRGRWHAACIVVMYAFAFPLLYFVALQSALRRLTE